MVFTIPDDAIVQFCGGYNNPPTTTAVDVGYIVKDYLYRWPGQVNDRRMMLAMWLLNLVEQQLQQD